MHPDDDPRMQRWKAEGYNPELIRTPEGWTVTFGADGHQVPEWGDWSGGPIWQATEAEAIESAALDEKMAEDWRRTMDRGLSRSG